MREALKNINGTRKRFIATFERYGTKSGYKGYPIKTLLFVNVWDAEGNVYTEHIWFTDGKQFQALNLKKGDNICFDARVKVYYKGYKGHRDDVYNPVTKDYKLSHPNNIIKSEIGTQGRLF